MVSGTTNRTVDVTVSIPQELWYSVGEDIDYDNLRAEYGANKCAGNNPDEEWLLRNCILPYLAEQAGMDPEGELRIKPTGEVVVNRARSEDGTFEGESE